MANEVGTATIDQLIIASPYEEPVEHWKYDGRHGDFRVSRVAGLWAMCGHPRLPNPLTIQVSLLSCRW